VLGPVATPADKDVIDALQSAVRDTDPARIELVWSAALSLAQLNQSDVAETVLKLLDRAELSKVQVSIAKPIRRIRRITTCPITSSSGF
jgi:hypothetical protein